MTVLKDHGPVDYQSDPGPTVVAPRGLSHKPGPPYGCKFLYLTSGQSLHPGAEDPRNHSEG